MNGNQLTQKKTEKGNLAQNPDRLLDPNLGTR